MKQPKIPLGHRYNLYQNLSPPDSELLDGLRGAPIVSVYSINLAGLMDIAAGDCAQSSALDNLIAEGWVAMHNRKRRE